MYMLSSFLSAPARADSRSQRLLIIKSLFKKERKERETESARHQRRAERLLDYQRNSQKIRPWDEGGEKEGRKRTGGTERGRERERAWMLTSTQTQSRGFILHRQRNTNRKRIFSSPGPERDKKKQFVFYSSSASLALFLCLHICKHGFVRAA